jgi:multiple sugar transport system substrate-binding protein
MAACAPAAPQVVEVVKEVPVEKVVKETVVVEKEVVVEKPVKVAEAVELQVMWRTSPSENKMLEGVIEAWDAKHPDISVKPVYAPWDEFEPKLMTMYAGEAAPDIIGTGGTNPYGERFVRGMVLAMDPYLDAEPELKEDLYPIATRSYTMQGKLIGLPISIAWPGVFYNATLFDEAGVDYPPVDWKGSGWTWDDMIETAKKLTLDKNGDGKTDQYGLNPGHRSPWYYTRLWGEDLISEEDYASSILHEWQTDDPDVYNALVGGLQARADAIYEHEVTPDPAAASALSQMGPMLKTGAVAMEFTGGWAVAPPLPEEFKFGAAANPLGGENGEGTRGNNEWVDPFQITDQSHNPDAAWEFCKYLVWDKEALRIRGQHTYFLASVQSGLPLWMEEYAPGLRAMSVADVEKQIQGGLEVATADVPCHRIVGWAAIRDLFHGELDPIWLGEKTAKEAVDAMIPLIQAAIKENLEKLGLE